MKNLSLRLNANLLFDAIDKSKEDTLKLDFHGIKTISRSFAQQYLERKIMSKKKIVELNMPDNISKMFYLVKSKKDSTIKFDAKEFEFVEIPEVIV